MLNVVDDNEVLSQNQIEKFFEDIFLSKGIDMVYEELLDTLSSKDIKDIISMEKERERQKIYHKKKAKCRNRNLDPDSNTGKGYITDVLVSKFLDIPTCFDVTDNFAYPGYDILEHEDFGIIDVKGSSLLLYKDIYFWRFHTRKNIKADFFFCIGYDEYMKNVECVYIIPNDVYISEQVLLYVNKNWIPEIDPYYWFKQDPKPWNDLFHKLKLSNCAVLRRRTTF